MKSPSAGKYKKIKDDKYYSQDLCIGHSLHMDVVDQNFTYIEPCCGAGDLINQIVGGQCVQAIDVNPEMNSSVVQKGSALDIEFKKADYIISNPPFSREYKPLCIKIIEKCIASDVRATYMLLPMSWAATEGFQKTMKYCKSIRPIPRIKWFDDGRDMSDTKDHAWYCFVSYETSTELKPRHKKNRMTNQLFMKKMNELYGQKYVFPDLDVLDFSNQLNIVCEDHGYFKETGLELMKGNACPTC